MTTPNNTLNPFTTQAMTAPRPDQGPLAATDGHRALAEVQAAMMIARANPRDPVQAMDRILNACTRPSLAESAIYCYSRGGTDVTGPSIRLAETLAQSWGNMQFGLRELAQGNGESTVQAFAWDVETNTRKEVTFQVRHVRVTRSGSRRLEDPRDVYELVANQGSRRLRACILAVIPGDVTEAAVRQCELTQTSSADTSPEGVKRMVDAFAKLGVTREQIEARIQRRLDAIRPAQVVDLRRVFTSIHDGMSAAADWFPVPQEQTSPATSATQAVKDKLKAKAGRQDPAPATPPPATAAEPAGAVDGAGDDWGDGFGGGGQEVTG
jgi:hypothetical protein